MVFDATIGSPTANSYVALEEGKEILAQLPQSPGIIEWLTDTEVGSVGITYTDEEREQTLVGGTMLIDAMSYVGTICSCEQRLQFPRKISGCNCPEANCSQIPYDIKVATVFTAAFFGKSSGPLKIPSGGGGAPSTAILANFERAKVGPIEVDVNIDGVTGKEIQSTLGQLPPFAAQLISPYLTGIGLFQVAARRGSVALAAGNAFGVPPARNWTGTMALRGDGKVYPRIGGWASWRRS